MFYCDECAIKRKWPITLFRSHGRCEMCKETKECSEMPSKDLPISETSGIVISHTVGENQGLYDKYGIQGGEQNIETSQLCEVIRILENRLEDK